jgi:hypothetical protein
MNVERLVVKGKGANIQPFAAKTPGDAHFVCLFHENLT